VRRGLGRIQTPALIIHAEEDDVASTASADYVERHLGSAVKRKLILHDSYHIITLDNEKETVADQTLAFFDTHAAASEANLKFA
jgi:carboxylesterase